MLLLDQVGKNHKRLDVELLSI